MNLRAVISVAIVALAAPFIVTVLAQDRDTSAIIAELKERRLAYRDSMRQVVELMQRRYQDGTDNIDGMLRAQIALADAELAIASSPEERITALQSSLDALKKMESFQNARMRVGSGRTDEMAKSKAARIYGEIVLLEERQRQSR